MIEKIEKYIVEVSNLVANTKEEAENLRIKYIGRNGILNDLFDEFKTVPNEQKRSVGQAINTLKNNIQEKIDELISSTKKLNLEIKIDVTLPGDSLKLGSRHPVNIIKNRIVEIFSHIGFSISEGPEIEDDWHVFSALNFPENHPARDMQDTFFIEKNPDILLRTHTSSVQVRVMEKEKPPIRTISPGRVFRNEAISARSHCIFHQVEGLYIDENVSFADLKQTLLYFAKEMFGENTEIRLRPSFFPFTEPSAEVDITCTCKGKGCNLCKNTGWLEILGCGMIDPNVLELSGIDSKKYTGFAFGMGVERIAMLKFGIKDIRLLFENDVRFLKQFE
ncbi:MAG: phenylalanine--tRNA ligase subunit alpha [Bacteroidetes bacterium GWA2_30_7]|nr:MAG: phenylalanine--tRNA ligase subunit alpha [Bacteroidetes bacterium GWA2_30_7]